MVSRHFITGLGTDSLWIPQSVLHIAIANFRAMASMVSSHGLVKLGGGHESWKTPPLPAGGKLLLRAYVNDPRGN